MIKINNCKKCGSDYINYHHVIGSGYKSWIECCECHFKMGGLSNHDALIKAWNYKNLSDTKYALHIRINSFGCGESLGDFELYDKVFEISEELFKRALEFKTFEDYLDELLFDESCPKDDDFQECRAFEEIELRDWDYIDRDDKRKYVNCRFTYYGMMGEICILECNEDYIKGHKNIYHYSKQIN